MSIDNECPCCIQPYNKTIRLKVICPHYLDDKQTICNYECCRSCTRRYLGGSSNIAHCMKCKKPWDRNFLVDNLTKSWVMKDYKIIKH